MIAASDSGFTDIVKLLVDKISELPDEERQKYLNYKKHVSKLTKKLRYHQKHIAAKLALKSQLHTQEDKDFLRLC